MTRSDGSRRHYIALEVTIEERHADRSGGISQAKGTFSRDFPAPFHCARSDADNNVISFFLPVTPTENGDVSINEETSARMTRSDESRLPLRTLR